MWIPRNISECPRLSWVLGVALLCGSISGTLSADVAEEKVIERLAFGSCADQNRPQPIWDAIGALDPQVFLFIGDNIYADTEDMDEMAGAYRKLGSIPQFDRFRRSVPILATWDDHDYGANDAGAEYAKKEESGRLLLDFFGVPKDSPRRQRSGIHGAWIYGPPEQRLQIILLDARSFRSPLTHDPNPVRRYRPDLDPEKTMLGAAQWRWLEDQLKKDAEIRLIVSGVRLLGYAAGFESWKNLPLELERLFQVIRETEANGVVFLSGDAHFTSLQRSDGGVGYPLYDFTSSGLSHSRPEAADRPLPLAILRPYGGLNFGTVEIDWRGDETTVYLAARDQDGNVVFDHTIPLAELQARRGAVD